MLIKKNAMILSIIFLSACAQKQMSREEWLAVTQRTYSNVKKEHLIAKAEEVLTLADGDDFILAHNQDGFTASRNWLLYIVIAASSGTDFWTFEVKPGSGDTINARVSVSYNAGNIVATGTSGGAITTPGSGSAVQGNAVYNIFWSRLDYLLGKTDQWMDCRLVSKKFKSKEYFGVDDALCNSFNMESNYPLDLSEKEVDRIFAGLSPDSTAKQDYLAKRAKLGVTPRLK